MKLPRSHKNSMLLIGLAILLPGCAAIGDWKKPDNHFAMKHEMRSEMMMDMKACMKMMHQRHSSEKPMPMMDMKNMSEEARQSMHEKMIAHMTKCMEGREKVRQDGGEPSNREEAESPSSNSSEHQH